MAQAVQKAAGDVSDAQKTLQSGGRVVATPTPTPSPPPTLNINIPGLGGNQAQQNGASMSTPSTTNSYPAYTGQSTQVRPPCLASSMDTYPGIPDTDEVAFIYGEGYSLLSCSKGSLRLLRGTEIGLMLGGVLPWFCSLAKRQSCGDRNHPTNAA